MLFFNIRLLIRRYNTTVIVRRCSTALRYEHDLDTFETLLTSTRSSHLTITEPCIHIVLIALPFDGLYMCRIDNLVECTS